MKKAPFSNLKNILASPYIVKSPLSLTEKEMDSLEKMLSSIKNHIPAESEQYFCINNILLGLANTLKAVNNNNALCILLSSSIKPIYIINVTMRCVNHKNANSLIYVQPNLELFTERLFGVKTMAIAIPMKMVFSNDFKTIGKDFLSELERKYKGYKVPDCNNISSCFKNTLEHEEKCKLQAQQTKLNDEKSHSSFFVLNKSQTSNVSESENPCCAYDSGSVLQYAINNKAEKSKIKYCNLIVHKIKPNVRAKAKKYRYKKNR